MDIWRGSEEYSLIYKNLLEKKLSSIGGLNQSAFLSLVSEICEDNKKNTLVVAEKETDIENYADVLSAFYRGGEVLIYPHDYPRYQIAVVKALREKDQNLIVAAQDSLFEKIYSPEELEKKCWLFTPGKTSYEEILDLLPGSGYDRVDIVSEPGEFSRRGEVIDIWPPSYENPVRLIFELDKLSALKTFRVSDQLTVASLHELEIYPASFENGRSDIIEHLNEDFIIASSDDMYVSGKFQLNLFSKAMRLVKAELSQSDISMDIKPFDYSCNFENMKTTLYELKDEAYSFFLTAPYEKDLAKLRELLYEDFGIEPESSFLSRLRHGFMLPSRNKVILSISDIYSSYRVNYSLIEKTAQPHVEEFSDLVKGDYVVHKRFGIGRYEGIKKIKHGFSESDFLQLTYSGSGKIYVAVENADIIQKFSGAESSVRLNSLSGSAWKKTTDKVRQSVRDISKKILEIYNSRVKKGISFKPYPEFEQAFEDYFPYKLTPHQKKAVEEVLSDMESLESMDRLVCGDVGFGKTEVAMRAAYRAVLNGYQVALLVPTTVLARQHFNTFRTRFKNTPVNIEILTRLEGSDEEKRVVRNINDGKTDLVIGTHKLLSGQISFPSLGLIIIDEEQRFGVEQKEKLRFRYRNVDLLTTTATPIPRTLAMAFGKVKGFSLISTPPPGRIAVKTQVMPYDMEAVKEAISFECSRGGQCFFVHSRVGSIARVTEKLRKEMPELSFEYMHGRLSGDKIARIMTDFIDRKFDCLISTTIIENGIDIANVNTMIIDHAHNLGLSDIYQLRGRIGRSNIRAYCYLMYPDELLITDSVKRRLSALSSFSAMGSGFQLALRDLEIRGAGELLGHQQHGNIMKVGFERYSEILKEELSRLKGEDYIEAVEVDISLPVNAFIPEEYIGSSALRLAFYRRLSSISDEEALDAVLTEMEDRFGNVPEELVNLFSVIRVKLASASSGIVSVNAGQSDFSLVFANGEKLKERFSAGFSTKALLKYIRKIGIIGKNRSTD